MVRKTPDKLAFALTHHPRQWRNFRYVYPVISRRSGGLSIGINLNPDKVCNFDCVYCCVERNEKTCGPKLDLDHMAWELEQMLQHVRTERIWEEPEFSDLPESCHKLRDISFSGEGEPTAAAEFEQACHRVVQVRAQARYDRVPLVLMTNATLLHRPAVKRGLDVLKENNGQIWAKLDFGSPAQLRTVNRTGISFKRIMSNLTRVGRDWPLVLQSMFLVLDGQEPDINQITSYIDCVTQIRDGGCHIKQVQLYTVARQTAEASALPVSDAFLNGVAAALRKALPNVDCHLAYAVTPSPTDQGATP